MDTFPTLLRKDRNPIRYLVVDDSVFARKNVAKMVESFGGEIVGEAGDGCTAITEYDRTMPDMVLMDITMPQMEGIEAAERIVRSDTRKTSSRRCKKGRATLCRSRSSPKSCTK
jgi:CheY-like chemotaxis protein